MHFSILDKSVFVYYGPGQDLWTSLTIHRLVQSAWRVANGAVRDGYTQERHFDRRYFSSGKCQFIKVDPDTTLFFQKK